MPRPRLTSTLFFAATYLLLVIPLGILLWSWAVGRLEPLPSEELRVLRLVHDQILEEFVEDSDSAELMRGAIEGMVDSLGDPFSTFIAADEVQHFRETELEGTYQGIGVLIVTQHSPLTVRAPLEGGPAQVAGIHVGDRIVAVDGEDISQIPAEQINSIAQERLRGPADSSVRLTVERGPADSAERVDLEVRRGHVPQPKVRWTEVIDPERRLGYLHVVGFQRGVAEEFDRAVAQLQADAAALQGDGEDPALRGLVLDLRSNPGGLLTEAVELANRFIADGTIVSLRRRGGEVSEIHPADPGLCTLPDLPLVVLVNQRSASASEVLSGALQDHGRATLVGERTYGKGIVQSIYSWEDHRFRLKLTTSRYYTPNGRPIMPRPRGRDGDLVGGRQGPHADTGGLAPDLAVAIDDTLYRRIAYYLAGYEVPRAYREAAAVLEQELELTPLRPLGPDEDLQLAAALRELRRELGEDVPEPAPIAGPVHDVVQDGGQDGGPAPREDDR